MSIESIGALSCSTHPISTSSGKHLAQLGIPQQTIDRFAVPVSAQDRVVTLAHRGDQIVAAALCSNRRNTLYTKVNEVWTAPGLDTLAARTVEALILDDVERNAWQSGKVAVKREYRTNDNSADRDRARRYEPMPEPTMAGPEPSSVPVPFGQVKWRRKRSFPNLPYVRQSTSFTCGPAALSMALTHLGLTGPCTRADEMDIWREATFIGGRHGCDPFGLAVAAERRGAVTDVWLDTTEPIYLGLGRQSRVVAFDLADLRALVERRGIALVVVDEMGMHGESTCHWILVHALHDGVFVVHDPWTEVVNGESWVDSHNLPVSPDSLDSWARCGSPEFRAMIALPDARATRRPGSKPADEALEAG
jgi:hypothetical protein